MPYVGLLLKIYNSTIQNNGFWKTWVYAFLKLRDKKSHSRGWFLASKK